MFHSIPITNKHLTPINPVIFGYENCKKSHSFGPAIREYHLIHYVLSGKGRFEIGGNTYNVSQGEMFVIPPDVETYYEADDKQPWSYIWIGFEADSLPVELENKISCPSAEQIFLDMKKCHIFDNGRNFYLLSKLWELFAILENRTKKEREYIEKAISLIESEYMLGIGVDDISKRLNLNRSYFSSVFRKGTGMSPSDYIMEHRMKVAKKLLLENTSVKVAAHSVGYEDAFCFSKTFKKYYGVSPSQIKKDLLSL